MSRHLSVGRSVACWILSFAALAALLAAEPGHAQTPRVSGQGTAASSMGNAFSAQADDASALHYNPAGMTQLRGVQVLTGSLFIGGVTTHTSTAGQVTVGDRSGSVAWPPPTHFYVTANLKDIGFDALEKWTAGIGVTVPFGSLTEYQETAPFRFSTLFNTLPLLDIKPTIAYKLNDKLSFGLGMDIYTFSSLFGEGHTEFKFISGGSGGTTPGSQLELQGRDTALGFNASMMYTPFRNAEGKPLANIGIVYRSQATLQLQGTLLQNGRTFADARAPVVLPQIITGAIALWPIRDQEREWKLELDVDHVNWHAVRHNNVSLSNGGGIPLPNNWRNSYNVMVGTEYKFLKIEQMPDWEVAMRAGYTQVQAQMPDQNFNPGIPSADNHIPSVGLGFTCKANGSFLGLTKCSNIGLGPIKSKSIGLDLSYQMALYEDRFVTGHATNPAINGTYRTTIHAGGVSLRFNF